MGPSNWKRLPDRKVDIKNNQLDIKLIPMISTWDQIDPIFPVRSRKMDKKSRKRAIKMIKVHFLDKKLCLNNESTIFFVNNGMIWVLALGKYLGSYHVVVAGSFHMIAKNMAVTETRSCKAM
jgi:hypothetical protein